MREILFRAKQPGGTEWFEGDLVRDVDNFGEHRTGIQQIIGNGRWRKIFVDPETVCQYTGLQDKNGRKIFEGDILSAHLDRQYPDDITFVQITWNGFSWCMRESVEDDVMSGDDCNTFEVCGNIFDNPGLITG